MDQAITEWCEQMTADRKSPKTIEGYSLELRALRDWGMAQDKRLREEADFGAKDLVRFIAHRRRLGLADATIKRTVAAVRSFFLWSRGRRSPAAGLKLPKVSQRPQRTLTEVQAFDVLASCDTSSPIGRRDLALQALLLSTGLRAAEVCRLRLDDVDLPRRFLVVLAKGQIYTRRVFSEITAAYLADWLDVRQAIADEGVLEIFIGIGGSTPGQGMTPDGLRAVFRSIAQRAGLKEYSPHDLRRTFATLLTKRGAPSRIVQVAGGWGDLKQVERYTQAITPADMDPYDPVAGIMG